MIDTTHIENSILGTLILWPARYTDVSKVVYPFMFAHNKALADYVWALLGDDADIDVASLTHDVQAKQICTPEHILAITEAPAMDDMIRHCEKLKEAFVIRQDSERYEQARRALMAGEDYQKVRADFEAELTTLTDMVEIKADRREQDIREAYEHLVKAVKNDGLNGVPTGFHEVDKHTAGWQGGNLILIGARPGMGKTTIALDFAYAASLSATNVMFVSLEMTSKEVYYKIAAKRCGIEPNRMQRGYLTEDELPKVWQALEEISELPIYVFDDRSIGNTLQAVKDKAMQLRRDSGLGLVVVDYIQLMRGEGQSKNEKIESISQGLKRMAKALEVPVIALSQLSRDVEKRGGTKRPQMADLRDSGSLEQDGDIVGFVYRPEYYDITEDEDGNTLSGKVELIFSKHRMGGPRSFWFDYVAEYDSYLDICQSLDTDEEKENYSIPAASRPGSNEPIPF